VLQIFKVEGASPDHPFSSIFPEGRYLKAVFARVFPSTKAGDSTLSGQEEDNDQCLNE
jgi:23S rRNA (cytosine1962-C5)-methyltransferase